MISLVFTKLGLFGGYDNNSFPYISANGTALSFKTGTGSQRSCYFIARILMFFPRFMIFRCRLGY